MNTTYRKNLKDVATACKNYTDKRIEALKWELGTYDLSMDSDSSTAYTKTVPSDATKCHINKIGGMSYKSENLLVLNDVAEKIINGITYKVENGVVYLSGTATTTFNLNISNLSISNKNIVVGYFVEGTINTGYCLLQYYKDSNTWTQIAINSNDSTSLTNISFSGLRLQFYAKYAYTNFKLKLMLVNGTTAPTEFKEGFTGIRDSAVTSVVSKDSNDTTLDTLTIPAEVQALEGYGWGVNDTCYNYVDFETKKFVKKVARVDLGSLSWTKNTTFSNVFNCDDLVSVIKKPVNASTKAKILMANYITETSNIVGSIDMGVAIGTAGTIYIHDSRYSSPSDFKTAMSGVYLYYELATPVETDITLSTNEIVIEASGTLESTNTYSQAVPSDIDYLIEEVKP